MKKLAAAAVVIFATFTVTGCDTTGETYEQRIDRLYKECVDAGGSFSYKTEWGTEFHCTVPGTDTPSGNVDVEVNN